MDAADAETKRAESTRGAETKRAESTRGAETKRAESTRGAELPAGAFSSWLHTTLDALEAGGDVDVPCGSCTACCRSAYFIHVAPDEVESLRRIPRALQFPAPGLPKGHVVLGYDERGHCPMLVDDRCSIYEVRPRTCRQYDCRVFVAAGIAPEDDGKVHVAAQVRRWRFDHPTPQDVAEHDAVREAAVEIRRHPQTITSGDEPRTAADVAVLAMRRARRR